MKQTIEDLLTADVAIEIASHEAVIRTAYKDSKGVWTWSVGLTSASGHMVERYKDNPQSLEYCLGVYVWALRRYAAEVLEAFEGYELKLNEFAAALSFHWNTGAIKRATWVKTVKEGGSRDAAYQQFLSWNKPKEIIGRRTKEAELFFNGKWSNDGKMTEYTRLTKSYTPVWSSAKRIDVSHTLSKLLHPAVNPVPPSVIHNPPVEAPAIVETPSEPEVVVLEPPVLDYPVEAVPQPEYSEPSETSKGDKPMEKTMGVVRHIVTGIGAVLVTLGFAEAEQMSTLTENITVVGGAILSIAGVAASIYAKVRSGGIFGNKG